MRPMTYNGRFVFPLPLGDLNKNMWFASHLRQHRRTREAKQLSSKMMREVEDHSAHAQRRQLAGVLSVGGGGGMASMLATTCLYFVFHSWGGRQGMAGLPAPNNIRTSPRTSCPRTRGTSKVHPIVLALQSGMPRSVQTGGNWCCNLSVRTWTQQITRRLSLWGSGIGGVISWRRSLSAAVAGRPLTSIFVVCKINKI